MGSDSHSRKEWPWLVAALGAYVSHLGFSQATQACMRVLAVTGKVSPVTVVAVRFQGVFLVALVAAGLMAWRRRSRNVFRPGDVRLQIRRAAAQTGTTLFGLLAAGELTGAMQSALLVCLLPLASLGLAAWRARRQDQPRGPSRSLLGPLVYGVASAFLAVHAGTKGASVMLGVVYLVCAAVANAALVQWTSDASRESLATSMLWQNGPAAILTLLMWAPFAPAPLQAEVSVSPTSIEALILLGMLACSTVQQLMLQVATRCARRAAMAVVQITACRGAQVYIGALFDWVSLARVPYPTDVAAFVVVAVGLPIAWFTARSRVRAVSVPSQS